MEIYKSAEIIEDGNAYVEFLRKPEMSAGIYSLPVDGVDLQKPHTEDEIYCVLAGRSKFVSGGREVLVNAGDVLYVPAKEPHRFFEITEALELLVFFGPAEGSRAPGPP
jgi:mannose-6-phosphate isomerase-like protein (cupin superfamily)